MPRNAPRPARPRPDLYEGAVWWTDLAGYAGLARIFLQRMQPGGPDGRGFHTHSGAQFLLAVHGHAELEVRGAGRIALRAGEACAVAERVPHRWDAIPDGGIDVFSVILAAAAPLETARLGAQLVQAGRFAMPGKPAEWNARLAELGAEIVGRSAGRTALVASKALSILVEAARHAPAQANPAEGAGGGSVARAETHFAKHLAEPVSLDAAAQAAGVSAGHLVRLFKAERGTTPMRALARLRVEAAKTLLLTTDWDTQRIAVAVGLGNAQYFSRVFRQVAQEPPRTFRRRMRRSGLE